MKRLLYLFLAITIGFALLKTYQHHQQQEIQQCQEACAQYNRPGEVADNTCWCLSESGWKSYYETKAESN